MFLIKIGVDLLNDCELVKKRYQSSLCRVLKRFRMDKVMTAWNMQRTEKNELSKKNSNK